MKKRHQTTNLTNLLEGDDPQSLDIQKSLKSKNKCLQNRIFVFWNLWNRQLRLLEGYEGLFIHPTAKTPCMRSHVSKLRSHVLKKTCHMPFNEVFWQFLFNLRSHVLSFHSRMNF